MKTCMYCGSEQDDQEKVCSVCGSELPHMEEEPAENRKKRSWFGKKTQESIPEIWTCTGCGAEYSDRQDCCGICGSPLERTDVYADLNTGKKSVWKSPVIKWVAAGLAVLGIAGGAAVAVLNSDEAQVNRSGSKLGSSLTQQVQQMTNLEALTRHLENLTKSGKYTAVIRVDTQDADGEGTLHYDVKDEIMDGTLAYSSLSGGVDLEFDFSSDNEKFMLASDRLTADIYGFTLEEFSKTPLAGILPLPVDEEGKPDLFQETDFAQQMRNRFGTAWDKLIQSVEYKEINERQMTIGDKTMQVRAFEITWNTDAALNLAGAVIGKSEGFLSGFAGLFSAMDPDCRIYINEDHEIVAVDFVTAGNKCLIEFAGEENPWQKCIVSSQAMGGGAGIVSGFLNADDAGIEMQLRWMEHAHYSFRYDDASGEFVLDAGTKEKVWRLAGTATSENGSAGVECRGVWGDLGEISISLTLEPLEGKPQHLASHYVDLMDMGSGDWQRLMIELSN